MGPLSKNSHIFSGILFQLYFHSAQPDRFQGEMVERPAFDQLAIFVILHILKPFFIRQSKRYAHGYLAVQTITTATLLYLPTNTDYFAVLFSS